MAKVFLFISPHFPKTYYRFIEALKERGFICLGIGSAPYYEIPKELQECIDEYYCCRRMDDLDNEKIAVEYYLTKYNHIDYIESNNDYWLEKDALLRELYRIPNGPRPYQLEFYRHKSLMKEKYTNAGVKVAKWIIVTTYKRLVSFANRVHYPIFIKPDVGVGAEDNHKINNEAELLKFYEHKKDKVTYIAEQYITGDLVSFDGISNSKGEVIFYASNEFSEGVSDTLQQHRDMFYYTVKEVDPKLVEVGKATIKAFDVENRFFHCEFFRLTKTIRGLARKGEYVALETNMRPAGGYTPDLINFANSVSCYEIYADSIAYDENRQDMSGPHYYAACASRRDKSHYLHSDEEIAYKYYFNLCYVDRYPKVFAGAMGDRFFMAKFSTLDEVNEFHAFVDEKAPK